MTKLLACPFCGSDAKHTEKCYFSVLAAFKSSPVGDLTLIPDLADAWNSRCLVNFSSSSLTHTKNLVTPVESSFCPANDPNELSSNRIYGYMVANFDGPDGYEFVYRQVWDNMSVLDRSRYVIKQVLFCIDSEDFPFD